MAMFGRSRDISFFNSINNELIQDVIELELLIYKFDPSVSKANSYNEVLEKYYYDPVLVNHLTIRADQQNNNSKAGADNTQSPEFRFYKPHLIAKNIYLEQGDIIEWHQNFYEVFNIVENQYFMGKTENTSISEHTKDFGYSVSIIAQTTLIRPDTLNIIDVRQ